MPSEFSHEPDAQRYTMHRDGRLVSVLDYRVNRGAIAFNHTFTTPPFRGHGYAGKLVRYAVDDVEATTGYRIVPSCWYVAEWFDEHPDRAALLTRTASV